MEPVQTMFVSASYNIEANYEQKLSEQNYSFAQ